MRTRYWSLGVVLGGLAVAGTAWAALDCGPVPSCEELGFTNTADQCDDSGMLKCPFDETAVFCRKKATGIGCEVGSVLYSNLNCYKPDAAPSGLTAIGVVFDTYKKLAVALDQKKVKWAPDKDDIPDLKECNKISVLTDCNIDGKANTAKIVAYQGRGTSYAAGYCYAKTDGVSATSWFLPSAKQWQSLYNNKDVVDATLNNIGGSPLTLTPYEGYWTSNEYLDYAYVAGRFGVGGASSKLASTESARCVIGYGEYQAEIEGDDAIVTNCEIGSILYSDKKCYYGGDPYGVVPIGVVFDTTNRLVAQLGARGIQLWSRNVGTNTSLTDCPSSKLMICNIDGKANTATIIAELGTDTAAGYCQQQSEELGLAGISWFLPSIKQLSGVFDKLSVINSSLASIGERAIDKQENYWSSNESSARNAYYYNVFERTGVKSNGYDVLCISNY